MTTIDNDGKIVLIGVFSVFNKVNGNNGRIYPADTFIKHIREYEIKIKREQRIEKLKKISKLNE